MTLHYADDHLTVHVGDCRQIMVTLPAESVHCVVTSPPYWGLRDYGTASWLGGDEGCDHLKPSRQGSSSTLVGTTPAASPPGIIDHYGTTCGKCGATRQDSQLGLEPTPEAYVANMVDVFREVRRVLRSDGTVWLNLGDSYVAGQGGRQSAVGEMPAKLLLSEANPRKRDDVDTGSWAERDATTKMTPARGTTFLKPKDLVGIPWRVALALQADGWYLRSDIIWAKPNPMPESVTDRPTKSHEYVFLLSKSARYYYDADAVREPLATYDRKGGTAPWTAESGHSNGVGSSTFHQMSETGRNLRSVWTIATQPYPGAHFATFPQKLVEPCIKAGTSEKGVCSDCGAPWVREVERIGIPKRADSERTQQYHAQGLVTRFNGAETGGNTSPIVTTIGWRPSCLANGPEDMPEPIPATVLDPFAGSGTTGLVANRLGRRAILIDLSADYIDQAMIRNQQAPLGMIG